MNDQNMADTGGLRNEEPLTDEQKRMAVEYAVSLGMPEDSIVFVEHGLTSYGAELDVLKIGTDVLPLPNRSKIPNCNVSMRGAIAHEIVGHREAALNGATQKNEALDEAQASIRAARFALRLSDKERMDLLRDGIARLRNKKIPLRSVKQKLNIFRR